MAFYNLQTETNQKQTSISGEEDSFSQIRIIITGEEGAVSDDIGTGGAMWQPEGTLGAHEETQSITRPKRTVEPTVSRGRLDLSLLDRAEDIIDSFSSDDVVESVINLEALRGIVLGLWKSAKNSSPYHQDILSTLENALLCKNDFTTENMALFQEAVMDLKNEVLVEEHVKVISSRFIKQGFSPLAFLSGIKDDSK